MPGWEMTVTTDTEALVRRAYHLAEGDVLDVQGFIDLFAEDGVFNGIGGVSGQRATGVSNWSRCSTATSLLPPCSRSSAYCRTTRPQSRRPRPNDKADRQGCAAAEQPRTSGRVTQGSDGLLSSYDLLDLDRVEAEHLHVRQHALPR